MGLVRFLDDWTIKKIGSKAPLAREDINSYTAHELKRTVAYAYENSSFYREKYAGCDLEDFENLPFATPEELRERAMDFLCVKPGEISRIVTLDTGGSTGKPKRVYFTEEDQQLTVDFFENGMQLMADSSDKILILMPAKVPGSIGKLLAEGLKNFGAEAIEYGLPEMGPHRSDEDNEAEAVKIIELINSEEVTGVVALPTHMEMLAEYNGFQNIECRLKWVLLSAEYVSDEAVQRITKGFNCKAYEHYGMTEMGLGCAVSCGCSEGYHVREADLYIEIIDPETGDVIPDGQIGEIVFTTLTREGMPFIRYRTGDYSRWIPEVCACGSILRRLDKVGPRDVVKGYLKR